MSPAGGRGAQRAHPLLPPLPPHRRDLPHRVAEADCRQRCPRRVPRQQRGGHQRAAHYRRTETHQAAVLPEPVTAPRRPARACTSSSSARPSPRRPPCPPLSAPSVTGSCPPIELRMAGRPWPRKNRSGRHLSARSLEKSRKPRFLLGPRCASRRGGAHGPGGWAHRAGFSGFPRQTPGSDCLPPSVASWPSWSAVPIRNPLPG